MSLISIVLTLVLVGAGLWAINRFIPMASSVKTILNAVVVIIICIWLLQVFGIINEGSPIRLN